MTYLSKKNKITKKGFVFLFSMFIHCMLFAEPLMVPNWSHLKRLKPKYEQVSIDSLTIEESREYIANHKNNTNFMNDLSGYSLSSEIVSGDNIREKNLFFKDKNGSILWSLTKSLQYGYEDEISYNVSPKGIALISGYKAMNVLTWVNKVGKILHNLEIDPTHGYNSKSIDGGSKWIIKSEFDFGIEQSESNISKARLIFTTSNGQLLNDIDVKYTNFTNNISISLDNKFIFTTCYEFDDNQKQKVYSYLLDSNGTILKEYPDKSASYGYFSPDNSIYLSSYGICYIIDMSNFEVITSFKSRGPAYPANKDTGLMAVREGSTLRIINYNTKRLLFQINYSTDTRVNDIIHVDISGDGEVVQVITYGNILYTYQKITK